MSLLKEELEYKVREVEFEAQESLNKFPKWKKILLITLVIAVIPAYIIAKDRSYAYWKQKYAPLIVSAKQSFENPKPLKIGNVMAVSNGNGTWAAFVDVTNENLDLSAHDVPFAINFYNQNKEQIYTYSDSLYLLPNTTKHIIIPKIAADKISSANPVIPPTIRWQRKMNLPKVNITLTTPVLMNSEGTPALNVQGEVRNNSPYHIKSIRLEFFLKNSAGQIIGVTQRDEFDVTPAEHRAYKVTWPNISTALASTVDIYEETNILDPTNLVLPDFGTNPASDLSRPDTSNNNY